jgi:hypothetical protein
MIEESLHSVNNIIFSVKISNYEKYKEDINILNDILIIDDINCNIFERKDIIINDINCDIFKEKDIVIMKASKDNYIQYEGNVIINDINYNIFEVKDIDTMKIEKEKYIYYEGNVKINDINMLLNSNAKQVFINIDNIELYDLIKNNEIYNERICLNIHFGKKIIKSIVELLKIMDFNNEKIMSYSEIIEYIKKINNKTLNIKLNCPSIHNNIEQIITFVESIRNYVNNIYVSGIETLEDIINISKMNLIPIVELHDNMKYNYSDIITNNIIYNENNKISVIIQDENENTIDNLFYTKEELNECINNKRMNEYIIKNIIIKTRNDELLVIVV